MNYLVIAMNRTGHRYVCAWIINNLHGKVELHRNCVVGWQNNKMIPDAAKVIKTVNPGKGSHTIKTIEEIHLWWMSSLVNLDYYKKSKFIVVVRSPRNWLASCLRGGGHFKRNLTEAREEIKNTHWVLYPHSRIDAYKSYFNTKLPPKAIIINYDRFVTNNRYKNHIRKLLNLRDITNKVKNDINQQQGSIYGYSSFEDNIENYTERYAQLSEQKTALLNKYMDKEMLEIERKFF